jgi:mono/diheme cytochrome c family protein
MLRSNNRRMALRVALALSTSTTISAIAFHASGTSAPAARHDPAPDQRTVVLPDVPQTKTKAPPAFDPARAWVDLGCIGCHGDDGIYRDEIRGGLGKPVDAVARWIRNAPSIKPHTDMPRFEDRIDEADSVALARWVLELAARRD